MLRAADVTFGYGNVGPGTAAVLHDVSLEVPSGAFVGIIGPNGSGKTTLLRLLAGTRKPQRGAVFLDETPLSAIARGELARRMAVVPQETHLAFDYSVLEVVLMGRYPHLGAFEIEGPADVEIAREALAATGTLAFERRMFETLSGGEKQRVIIAAALAQIGPWVRRSVGPWVRGSVDPWVHRSHLRASTVAAGAASVDEPRYGGQAASVLLLDEPTAALDLKYQLEIGSLLRDLHKRLSLSIVLSTHDLNFAAALCDTLVMIKDGHIVTAGPVDAVLTPGSIRKLYDVEADVSRHPQTGHLTVIPLKASSSDGAR